MQEKKGPLASHTVHRNSDRDSDRYSDSSSHSGSQENPSAEPVVLNSQTTEFLSRHGAFKDDILMEDPLWYENFPGREVARIVNSREEKFALHRRQDLDR